MVTQTLKRWLHKLFAWWPWKHSSESGYAQVASDVSRGQEPMWRTTGENAMPQPGMASVVVENGREENIPEISRSTSDERSDHAAQQRPPENVNSSLTSSSVTTRGEPPPAPTEEQQLAFLNYLVKRGLVNEGFAEGQLPEQYKRKR
jgi:hypothetical protein